MQSGGCEDVGLSSHAPCLFVFFSLSICLSICFLSTLFLSVYYALDFSLTPSLRPPSGCSNELINHGCWCLAGLAVTKEVANKLLWRKEKKKWRKVLHAKGNSVTDRDKMLQREILFFIFFSLMAQRQAVCNRPFPSGVDHFISDSSEFPNFQTCASLILHWD